MSYDAGEHLRSLAKEHLHRRDRSSLKQAIAAATLAIQAAETVLILTDAVYRGNFGLLIVTDDRLLFLERAGEVLVEESLDRVSASNAEKGGAGTVIVALGETSLRFEEVGDVGWAKEVSDVIAVGEPDTAGDGRSDNAHSPGAEPRASHLEQGLPWLCRCGMAFADDYPDVLCMDCGSPLMGSDGLQRAPETIDNADGDGLESSGEEVDDVVLTAFETNNPYYQRLFRHPAFGRASSRAISLLAEVSPDEEERLLVAVRTRHGGLKRGYLVATTSQLRWIQTVPMRDENFWPYDYPISLEGGPLNGGIIVSADGCQFQLRWSKAKAFTEVYRLCQQGLAWELANGEHPPSDATGPAPASPPQSLAAELSHLAQLRDDGVLTDEEFTAAKARVLGQSE